MIVIFVVRINFILRGGGGFIGVHSTLYPSNDLSANLDVTRGFKDVCVFVLDKRVVLIFNFVCILT